MAPKNLNRPTTRASKSTAQLQRKPEKVENLSKKTKEVTRNLFIPASNCPNNYVHDQFAKTLDGEGFNHTNGWISESGSESECCLLLDHNTEVCGPLEDWKGNAVGLAIKRMLEAVEHNYPDTFRGVEISSKLLWLSILKELYMFITRFLGASVDALSEGELSCLEGDLNVFEKLGFDLSWVRRRMEMVRELKFGNDLWRVELEVVEECLACSCKEMEDITQRLEMARLDHVKARDARDKKVAEVKHRFGQEYEDVLRGNLGAGILPGY